LPGRNKLAARHLHKSQLFAVDNSQDAALRLAGQVKGGKTMAIKQVIAQTA
jgi:hypothetical protein